MKNGDGMKKCIFCLAFLLIGVIIGWVLHPMFLPKKLPTAAASKLILDNTVWAERVGDVNWYKVIDKNNDIICYGFSSPGTGQSISCVNKNSGRNFPFIPPSQR
ncbi:hypothetical protein ACFLRA_03530 [Bdellovibrionota bacterium]